MMSCSLSQNIIFRVELQTFSMVLQIVAVCKVSLTNYRARVIYQRMATRSWCERYASVRQIIISSIVDLFYVFCSTTPWHDIMQLSQTFEWRQRSESCYSLILTKKTVFRQLNDLLQRYRQLVNGRTYVYLVLAQEISHQHYMMKSSTLIKVYLNKMSDSQYKKSQICDLFCNK